MKSLGDVRRPGGSFRIVCAAAVLFAAAAAGCSASSDVESDGGFPASPYMTLTSTSGALSVAMRSSPQPPPRGIIEVELTVTQRDGGAPVDGLTVSIDPWMPAMNHGAVAPTVTAQDGGKYLVTDLDLFMAGLWQLKTTFSGPVADHVAPEFEVP
jgi:hypothetical protein